jgi:CheY-like chemotaxis protein
MADFPSESYASISASVVSSDSETIAPRVRPVVEASHRLCLPALATPIFLLAAMRRASVVHDAGGMTDEATTDSLRVLIVDDSPHFLDAAREVLQGEGLTVVGCASASAGALQSADELKPDVVLVDVDLGEESGFDLAARFAATARVRVVMISVYSEPELADLLAASPAAGFVAKSELSATAIRNVLGRAAGVRDS